MRPAPFASDRPDVASLITLVAGRHLELHPLPLGEGPETVHLDRRVVDEHVRAFVSCDESVALVVVEPLHRARRHARAPLSPCGPPATAPQRRHHTLLGGGCPPSWTPSGFPPSGEGPPAAGASPYTAPGRQAGG